MCFQAWVAVRCHVWACGAIRRVMRETAGAMRTFVIVVARQHSRNISRLSCFMELLICISIFFIYFYFFNNTLCVVLYGAVEYWLSGALVNESVVKHQLTS